MKVDMKGEVVREGSVEVESYCWKKNWFTSSCSCAIYAECSLLEFILP